MQVKTWFGTFTLHGDSIECVELFDKDIEAMVKRLDEEPLLLRGKVAGVDICELAVEYGFVASDSEYDGMLHEISIQLVKKQMVKAMTHDRKIIAAVEAIDDIDETVNILAERLKEWYMLCNETHLRGEELARHILKEVATEPDLRQMQSLASSLLGLYEARDSIEEYLKESMPVLAPNLASVAGHILGARLLSIAGGLEKLASMPSSTVQVIGASNALFRHLNGKAPSPKHGLIFRHPLVNTAPRKLRGKISKVLASKISLAVRYDCYRGELKEGLLDELEAKVLNIYNRYKPAQNNS